MICRQKATETTQNRNEAAQQEIRVFAVASQVSTFLLFKPKHTTYRKDDIYFLGWHRWDPTMEWEELVMTAFRTWRKAAVLIMSFSGFSSQDWHAYAKLKTIVLAFDWSKNSAFFRIQRGSLSPFIADHVSLLISGFWSFLFYFFFFSVGFSPWAVSNSLAVSGFNSS